MKISKKNLICDLIMSIPILYAMSQLSWGNLLSSSTWRFLFLLAIAWFIVKILVRRRKNVTMFISLNLLLLFAALINNANIKNGSYGYELFFMTSILFSIYACRKESWMKYVFGLLTVFGVFYGIMTLAAAASKGFYDAIINPFITSINGSQYLGKSVYYSNGFTAHYSFNGMYVALGVCCICGYLIPKFHNMKQKWRFSRLCILVAMLVALLLTNKRAHILFTMVGAFGAYYLYNCDRPTNRIVKLIAGGIIAVIAIYVLYSFFPSMFGFMDRFQESIEEGNVTNGRLELWALALLMKEAGGLIGTGWYSFYRLYGYHVHNVYIQLYIETGIIGFTIFLAYMITSFIKTIKILMACRKQGLDLEEYGERRLIVSLIYQTFFLLYCFTGTCIYEQATWMPYVIFCTITEFYWQKFYKKATIKSSLV